MTQHVFGRRAAPELPPVSGSNQSRKEGVLSFTLQAAGLVFVAMFAYATVRAVVSDAPATASPKQETRQAAVPVAKPALEPCGATMQEFNRLQTGMTISDVNRIIGCPGTELSRAEFGDSSTVRFMWEGSGSWLGNMNATFQDGRLMAKAQMGLK